MTNFATSDKVTQYDLPCLDGRKSFYGKARVIEHPDGAKTLQSYNTLICTLEEDGTLTKLNPTATPTTLRHVRSFLRHVNLAGGITAKRWNRLPLHHAILPEAFD